MQNMILLGANPAAVPARPACCYCKYDSRYAGNMFGGGIGFCTLFWNDNRYAFAS